MTARIDHSALVLGAELKTGGQGRILLVQHPRDADGGPLIFKRYRNELIPQVVAAALDALGDLPGRAGPDAVWLRERTAWPQTLITEGAGVVGFLMRPIPTEFYFGHPTPTGVTQLVSEFAFLLNEDRYLQDFGLLVSDRDRLLLLTDVADALRRFHRLGAAVGDLSPKNLLFALATHRTFFLDCDSMRLDGADVLPQTHTPDWELPQGEEPATPAADVLKFGLLATRMFARDQSERDPSRLGHVSPRLAALATASQGLDPQSRPTLDEWIPELQTAASTASPTPPARTVSVPIPPLFGPGAPPAPTVQAAQAVGGPQGTATAPPRNRGGMFATLGTLTAIGVVALGVATANGAFSSGDSTSAISVVSSQSSEGLNGVLPNNNGGSPTTPPDLPTPTPTTSAPDTFTPQDTPTPPPATSSVGVVQINPAVVDDPRAVPIATLFDTYFSAITAKNFDAALALYDPSGDIDTSDSSQRDGFKKADSTSSDDDGRLTALSPPGTDPVTAEVSFRSHQASGYGPAGNEDQTCTIWTLTYTLTSTSDGRYLIKSAHGTPSGC